MYGVKNMASLTLKNIKKVYPFNGDDAKAAKKRKKGEEPQRRRPIFRLPMKALLPFRSST